MKKPSLLDRLANFAGYIKAVDLTAMSPKGIAASPPKKQLEMLSAYRGWVYACAKARSTDVAGIKLRLFRTINQKTGEIEENLDHEVLSLLRRPNPWTTSRQFLEQLQVCKDLAGEAFIYLNRAGEGGTGKITQMWLVRPDWIRILPDSKNFIDSYELRVPGGSPEKLSTNELLHYKEFNPVDQYRGMSIVAAAAVTVDSEDFAEQYNRKFFENGALPSIVLKTEQKLDESLKARIKEKWNEEYGGKENAHRMALLEAGLELQSYSLNQKDMEFLEGQRYSRDKIMALFQVPKTVLGMTEAVTVSNAEATDYVFQKRVVKPEMEKLRDFLNNFLLPLYPKTAEYFFDFDDPVPENVDMKLKKYTTLVAIGAMTPNEVRHAEGMDEIPGLDNFYIPANLIPVLQDSSQNEDEETPVKGVRAKLPRFKRPGQPLLLKDKIAKDVAEDIGSKIVGALAQHLKDSEDNRELQADEIGKSHLTDEQQEKVWEGVMQKAQNYETQYKGLIRKNFDRQRDETIDRLNNTMKAVIKSDAEKINRIVFNLAKENKATAELTIPVLKELVEQMGDDTLDFLGLPKQTFDMNTAAITRFFDSEALKGIRSLNKTTRYDLRQLLAAAFADGKDKDQMAKEITTYFDNINDTRAVAIARTETLKANNYATLEAYKQSNVVVGKQWYTAVDERVCPMCGPLHGKVVGLSKDFFNKGESQVGSDGQTYAVDYEDIGAPPRHTNCRCTLIPVTIRR